MRVALSSLESFEGDKFAILGDMNELEESQAAHLQLLQEVDLLELKMVIIVGPQMALVKNHFPEIKWFATAKDVAQFIRYLSFEHSTILIKGSRSIKLESVLSAFN